jgi:hypothetical protein
MTPDEPRTLRLINFLLRVFDDEALTHFCYDHFREVHNRFSQGMTRTQKTQELVAHCERLGLLDDLERLATAAASPFAPPSLPPSPAESPGSSDTINAQGSQGFLNRPTGPVYQHFGDIVQGNKMSGTIGSQAQAGQVRSTDAFAAYEAGLAALLARIGSDHPRSSEALVYEQRLRENLAVARRYGDTREREAARAEVVDRLNDLAQATVGISFNELCARAG